MMVIRDPGWNKVGSGNWDKHPGSATLVLVGSRTVRIDNYSAFRVRTVIKVYGSGSERNICASTTLVFCILFSQKRRI